MSTSSLDIAVRDHRRRLLADVHPCWSMHFAGIPTSSATAGPSHFPIGITVGVVLAFGGFLLAVIGVTALLITRCGSDGSLPSDRECRINALRAFHSSYAAGCQAAATLGASIGQSMCLAVISDQCTSVISHTSRRKKRLHPSASPGRSLNEAQSTDVLKQAGGSGGLDGKVSGAATSTGTPSHQHFGGRDSLRTLHSDMEGSGGQLLGQRSSDLSMPQR